jgi:alanine-glyoxylate transaminase/serine-glyoxylate transaminase/serine-pyruvate transaminase
MYALREALRLVLEEGLEARWERHRTVSRLLTQGLEQLGLELFTPVAHRLPQLTVVTIPTGVDDRRVRSRLLEMGIEIGSGFAALSGKAWRIGLMGYNAREETVDRVLGALEEVLKQEGWRG